MGSSVPPQRASVSLSSQPRCGAHPQDHLAPAFTSPTLTLQCLKRAAVEPQANAFTNLKRLWRTGLASLRHGRGYRLVRGERDGNADHEQDVGRMRPEASRAQGWGGSP